MNERDSVCDAEVDGKCDDDAVLLDVIVAVPARVPVSVAFFVPLTDCDKLRSTEFERLHVANFDSVRLVAVAVADTELRAGDSVEVTVPISVSDGEGVATRVRVRK